MPNPRLVEFYSADGLPLPGLLFEAEESNRSVALYLHGNGSASIFNFVEATNNMASALSTAGIAYFPFNNRGAHIVQKINRKLPDGTIERKPYGTAFEIIKDCVQDIDGAVSFLEGLGYNKFYLIGESTGANKICVYDHYRSQNAFSKYVLVSSGDDSGIYFEEFGKNTFASILAEAKDKIEKGEGDTEASTRITSMMGYMSYQSVLDMLNPDGDYNTFPYNDAMNSIHLSSRPLFNYYSAITKPMMVVFGANDEYCYGSVPKIVDMLKAHANPTTKTKFLIIPDTDHAITGKSAELAREVAHYLSA